MKKILLGFIVIGLITHVGCSDGKNKLAQEIYKQEKIQSQTLKIGANADREIITLKDSTEKHLSNDTMRVNIGKFLFPLLEINDFITEFGEPKSVQLPDSNDPSSWGQFYEWNSKKIDLTAIAADYSSDTNYNAKVSLFKVSFLNSQLAGEIKMPLNTTLGMSVKDLEDKINDFIKKNKFWQINEVMKRVDHLNRIKDDEIFLIHKNWEYYLIFETNGQNLIGITQSDFNPYNAD